MTALMIKMTSWLVFGIALGFIVAWLLSRSIYKKRKEYAEDTLSALVLERNNLIDKLEKNFRNEKIMFEKISDDLKDSEKALAEKTSLLTTLQHRLENVNANKNDTLALKQKNNLLLSQIQKLQEADRKRVGELEGFEEILLLAEDKVENNEKNYGQILKKLDEDIELLTVENEKNEIKIKLYRKDIKDIQEELKLYKSDSSAAEFIISKDQFLKIEDQLLMYQKEIESLRDENTKLFLESKKNINRLYLEEKAVGSQVVTALEKDSDESSMVKVFRETYKKITKS